MNDIRQGKCEFADYNGKKHTMVWMVGVDCDPKTDRKKLIRKTDIWLLNITIDDEQCAKFEDGVWKKHPPHFGIPRRAYQMILSLYS